ncbi:hypothetical protein RGQ29_015906 [Quercus rubra]|uniref:Uncharacterized protein n=1 Tax=Quercus rubra TaxID=3512 RepID=A0AAN7J584_QUERU|nr:hypothetical protein RGQ29_015906 [Quercus rubra]
MAKVGMQVHSLVIKCGLDLSIETMSDDVVAVVKEMYGDSPPAIVLVGHRSLKAWKLKFWLWKAMLLLLAPIQVEFCSRCTSSSGYHKA